MKSGQSSIIVLAKGYLPDNGGIERYSSDLVDAYTRCWRRVYVLTQSSVGPGIRRVGRAIVIDVGATVQVWVFWRVLLKLRHLIGRVRPVFIHGTTWRISLPALIVGARCPLVVTVHGREVFVVPCLLMPIMKLVLKKADIVAVVSQVIADATRSVVSRSRAHWLVLWNGISFPDAAKATPERQSHDGPIRLYAFCRLVERKNLHGVLAAVALLKARGLDGFHLDIAGGGPERARLERLIGEYGIGPLVTLHGTISEEEVVPRYRAADIFIHPQITAEGGKDIEGFGLSIADAMSFGAAVVVGKDGGPSDFVHDGITGLVVDGHEIEAVADAIETLVCNPQLRLQIGRQGRDWALRELDWDKVAGKISAQYGGGAVQPVHR